MNETLLTSGAQTDGRVTGTFDFGEALLQLQSGGRVARSGWNGKGMYLAYVSEWTGVTNAVPELDGKHLPFIAMKTAQGDLVPWLASQTDVLAEDWVQV